MKCTFISSVVVSVFVLVVFASCGRREHSDLRKSGAEQPAPGEIVLAEVGDRRITLAAFEAELQRRGKAIHGTEAQRQKLLEEMIVFEVMLARAKAAGFDRTPGMQAQVDQLIVARFQEEQYAGQTNFAAPDEAALRAHYETHRVRFTRPTEVRAGLMRFGCSPKAGAEQRAAMRQRAAAVLQEAVAGDEAAFTLLVQKHSEDQATRYRGGDTGWMRVDDTTSPWPAAVQAALAVLTRAGECAPLVELPDGFYIVRLLERKPGGVRGFDEVRETIAYQVAQQARDQRRQDFIEAMKRGIKVEKHPELLKHMSESEQASDTVPPAVPRS